MSKTISSKFNIKYVIAGIIILMLSMLNSSIWFKSNAASGTIISPDVLGSSKWYCTHEGGTFHNYYPATYKRRVWKSYSYSYLDHGIVRKGIGMRPETETKKVGSAKVNNYYNKRSPKTVSSLYGKSQDERVEAYVLGSDMGQGYSSSAQTWVWGHGGAGEAYQYISDTALGFINDAGSDPISYNDKVGPFKINYDDINNKNAYSRLTKLVINYMDGSSIDSNIEIVQEGVDGGKPFTDVSKIKKNKEFYVINPNLEKEVKEIELTLNKRYIVYGATETDYVGKEALAEKLAGGWKCTDVLYTPQDLMYVVKKAPYWEEQEEIKRTFKINTKRGDIELTKKGIYNDQEDNLRNMTFKVYCNNVNKFIKDVTLWPNSTYERYEISFTDNIEEAKSYTTGENGVVLIQHLYAGRVNSNGEKEGYTYTLVEYDGGDNSYYIDPLKIENAESSYQLEGKDVTQDTGVTTGHKEYGGKTYCTVENITIFYDDNVNKRLEKIRVLIKDDRTSADLLIEKVDETFPDEVKLEGAEFKVKLVKSERLEEGEKDYHDLGIENEWLKKGVATVSKEDDGTRVYDYSKLLHDEYLVKDVNQAETFVTGKNGKIKILCVVNGEYQIYETKTSLGYDITRQWEYVADSDKQWVDYGTTVISTDDNHKENRLTNRKAVKIEGNVWEDLQIPSKDSEKYFSLKNPNAELGKENYKQIDESIQVNLWLKESKLDKIISTSERKLDASFKDGLEVKDGFVKVAYTMTDQDTGSWEINRLKQAGPNNSTKQLIEDIYYWDLTDAYIEFVYNNQTYICADPFAMMTDADMKKDNNVSDDERQISVENNSKAIEYELDRDELDDTNLTGTVAPKPGSAVTKLNATYGANSDVEMAPTDILSYNWYATDANGNYLVDNLDKLGLTGYYNPNPGHYSVEHINLALWRKDKPEYQIQETLRYSKILMNGYTYTYDYYKGDAEVGIKSDFVPTTNQQVADKVYGAKIYPSDVAYTATDANRENDKTVDDGMEMYVVYKIDITNNKVRSPSFRRNIYDEVRLYVTELTNTFNKDIYTLDSTQHTDLDDWEGSEYFDLWSNQGNDGEDGLAKAKYNIKADETGVTKEGSDQLSDGILPNGEKGSDGTETVYIQFKVNQEFLNAVLSGKLEEYNNGLAISQAHVTAHHAYTREDNVWTYADSEYMSDNSSNIYDPTKNVPAEYAIDGTQNSRIEDRTDTESRTTSEGKRHTFLHRTKDDLRDSGALGLLFELGAERTIEGTVYEDFDMPNDEENKGNGIIDKDETNVGTNVTVELIDNSTGNNATLYQKDSNEFGHKEVPNATVTTTENGRYSFVGVVPGIYRLKFTYSDGTTKIKDANGNIANFTSNDYKSTIINTSAEDGAGEYIRNAEKYTEKHTGKNNANMLGNIEAKDLKETLEWYKYIYNDDGTPRYNVATDDFSSRCKFEEYEHEADKVNGKYPPIMNSYTPFFSISVENDKQDKRNVEEKAYSEENNYELGHRNMYEEFNFGVIKTTKTDITLDKIISDVKLTTSSGTTLVQGSPRDALNYVTALDNLKEGSKYVRVEMPLDNIYGTALETTYKITISNNYVGDNKDYIENSESENFGQYFKYGNKTADAHLVKTTVTEVVDSMDPDYDLLNNTLIEKVHHPKEAEVEGTIISEEKGQDKEDTVIVTPTDGNLVLTEWDSIEVGGTTQVEYMASGIFRDDMDLTYNNNARITKIKLDKTQALKSGYNDWSNPIDTRLIITPDTGEDRSSTYIITGTVALIVLAAGIVIVKSIFTKKED